MHAIQVYARKKAPALYSCYKIKRREFVSSLKPITLVGLCVQVSMELNLRVSSVGAINSVIPRWTGWAL